MKSRILSLALLFCSTVSSTLADEQTVGGKNKAEWLTLIKDTNPRKREAAVIALGILGPKDRQVQDTFREMMLGDNAEKVRLKIINIVQDFEKDRMRIFIPTLADVLKSDKSINVRVAAVTCLGKTGEDAKPMLKTISDGLKDPEPAIRSACAETIGKIGSEAKTEVPGLILLLKDADSSVRTAAVIALGRITPEGANGASQLAELLIAEKDPNVRKEIARSVGLLGIDAKVAIPAIVKALKTDADVEVRQQAALSLGKMTAELDDIANELVQHLKNEKEKNVRILLVQSLANALGSKMKNHVAEICMVLLKEPEGEVRLAIVQELGNLGVDGKEALPALMRSTTDVQINVREAAKLAVKKIKGS